VRQRLQRPKPDVCRSKGRARKQPFLSDGLSKYSIRKTKQDSIMTTPALLVLADGSVFHGTSIGYEGSTSGEVVFNTSMTGYQEILTDPSYCKQIVTLTYPHIGNTGTNTEDEESRSVYAAGLIIRDLPLLHSNFRASESLHDYLVRNKTVAIADIDTRRLTTLLREKGAQGGAILTGADATVEKAQELITAFGSMVGKDLAKEVSCQEAYEWTEGEWALGKGFVTPAEQPFHVVAYDFGVKTNILRMLAARGCRLTVVPAQTSAEDVLALNPDGVFLSNGHQLISLAIGAKTLKMHFSHHGANHPVQDLDSGKVVITSQNHGFAVDADTLPANARITHKSLFDNTLQGIELTDKPVFCFQGHPEASPGPQDVGYLFDKFIDNMKAAKQ